MHTINRKPLKTKEEILEEVKKLGLDLAHNADAGTYSCERRYLAKSFQPKLEALRKAYKDIKKGVDPLNALINCRPIFRTGIELNYLNLIIHFIEEGESK